MNKIKFYIALVLFAILSVGCESIYYGGEATANPQENARLGKLQRIQLLQFELIEHPEYRDNLPTSITSVYAEDEIAQAFKNLKWERK